MNQVLIRLLVVTGETIWIFGYLLSCELTEIETRNLRVSTVMWFTLWVAVLFEYLDYDKNTRGLIVRWDVQSSEREFREYKSNCFVLSLLIVRFFLPLRCWTHGEQLTKTVVQVDYRALYSNLPADRLWECRVSRPIFVGWVPVFSWISFSKLLWKWSQQWKLFRRWQHWRLWWFYPCWRRLKILFSLLDIESKVRILV